MRIERSISQDPNFIRLVNQVAGLAETHPDVCLSHVVAQEFGNRSVAGISAIDAVLRDRAGELIPTHKLIPQSGNALFDKLEKSEQDGLRIDYATAWHASLTLALEVSKESGIFSTRFAVNHLRGLMGGTCVYIPAPLSDSTPDRNELSLILEKHENGDLLFTARDLFKLHPTLPAYLRTYHVSSTLEDVVAPTQNAIVKAAKEKISPINEMAKYVGTMPISAYKRELSDGLCDAQAAAALKSLETNFDKPYTGPKGR